ncbi:MAG TPA: NTP transferase domain-containing protein [Novosphingobium sp.]|nr:NTP transferase domain-containing protein [Novosphingobium sp.]
MAETCALIAAAGRGTRAGLPYPKTLFEVQGKPILIRVAEALLPHADRLVVLASPDGAAPIRETLERHGIAADVVIQDEPRGMGHAVLTSAACPAVASAEHVLLGWGDIPFFQPATVAAMMQAHRDHGNDLTLASALTDAAYTIVARDEAGQVVGLTETREAGLEPAPGERDIGLFVFRREPMFAVLRQDLPGKFGKGTGEHGFLYAIAPLAASGHRVEAVPVATELDLVSLNSLGDLKGYI